MIRITFWIGCLFLTLQTFAQQSSHGGAPKFMPGEGQVLLVIGQDLGAVGGLDSLDDGYVDHLGHVPAGVTTYTGFPQLTGLTDLADWGAGYVRAQSYLEDSTFDNSCIVIGLHLVNQLGNIIAGSSDDVIDELGRWIKESGRPVFLRIGYEFDASWNHYNPAQFKEAWKYIVRRFDALGVRNVAYVWQACGLNTANIERWYPGDNFVNWLGYSHFDEPNPGANILAFAEAHGKAVMIAEATPRRDLSSGEGVEHWDAWFAPLLEKIHSHQRIRALAYINTDWDSQKMWIGQAWGDSRIQVNDTVMKRWQEEVAGDTWIKAGDSLFDYLELDRWQDSLIGLGVQADPVEEELLIQSGPSGMLVRDRQNAFLSGVDVWDVSGRLMYRSRDEDHVLRIPAEVLPAGRLLILQVRKGKRMIPLKTIF